MSFGRSPGLCASYHVDIDEVALEITTSNRKSSPRDIVAESALTKRGDVDGANQVTASRGRAGLQSRGASR